MEVAKVELSPKHPARISYGHAQRNTHKGEDVWHAVLHPRPDSGALPPAGFGIFDGHGGRQAAEACSAGIVDRLLASADPQDSEAIEEAFWDTDISLGLQGVVAGSTASVLLVKEDEETGRLLCTLAWVGDSTAVCVDMMSPKAAEPMLSATTAHLPSLASEVERMETQWAVRKKVYASFDWGAEMSCLVERAISRASSGAAEAAMASTAAGAPTPGADEAAAERISATRIQARARQRSASKMLRARVKALEQVRAAMQSVAAPAASPDAEAPIVDGKGGLPHEAAASMLRVLVRGALMNELAQREAVGPTARLSSRLARQQTFVDKRFDGRGPLTVQASFGAEEAAPNKSLADTMMTRSIGDWDAARACVPQPELTPFKVEPGEFVRVVIASDGLWDFCTPEKASRVARRAAIAQAAASSLVSLAWTKSHQKFERLKDDTTVLVVDLDLSPPAEGPKKAANGCCALQ